MSYLVIARKFRPQTFSTTVGQEHITKALANAIIRDRVPHALLFSGPRGVGKTSTARVFAKALNCTGRSLPTVEVKNETEARRLVEPCGTCTNCEEIARSTSMAVWEIDGASHNSVENVRELIESLRSVPPAGSAYKIYIIDEVHMLSTAAFNALLKSLEEPPARTIFIFATTEPQKIPETVLSRCQLHDFRRLSTPVITECLREIADQEKVEIDDDVLQFIAKRAEGGMRDAQSMFDRLSAFTRDRIDLKAATEVFGVFDQSFFQALGDAVLSKQPTRCFSLLNKAFSETIDLRSFIADFIAYWRGLLVIGVAAADREFTVEQREELISSLELSPTQFEALRVQALSVDCFELQRLFEIAQSGAAAAHHSTYPRYILEATLAKMATIASLRPLPKLLNELQRLVRGGAVVDSDMSQVVTPLNAERSGRGTERSSVEVKQVPALVWEEFVRYVKSNNEPVLAAFLRRVSARFLLPVSPVDSSAQRVLEIRAKPFDLKSLNDTETLKGLNKLLCGYSAFPNWIVSFVEHQEELSEQDSSSDRDQELSRKIKKEVSSIPESIEALEKQARRERQKKVDLEAREHPLVQAALSTFEGSRIDKVSVLKSEAK